MKLMIGPVRVTCRTSASQPHSNTAATTPKAAATESRYPRAALIGTAMERKTIVSSTSERPTTKTPNGNQRAAELVGDVDGDGGEPGDLDVDAELVEPAIVLRAQLAHELGRRRVVGRRLGHDLHDAGVGGLVGRRERDGLDAGKTLDVVGQVFHEPERIGRGDDRAGQDEGAVEARAELLGNKVVALARLVLLGQHARVGQREGEARGGDRHDAEA